MKLKDKKQNREKTKAELNTLITEAREALFSLRMDKVQQKLKNSRSIFLKRKEIALFLTLLKEKELANE